MHEIVSRDGLLPSSRFHCSCSDKGVDPTVLCCSQFLFVAVMSSSDEDAGTLPQEERPTPRRSQRTRNRNFHSSAVQSPNSHDESPDDSEEVPSSLPPVLPSYTDDQEGDEQPGDKNLSSSSEDDEYATAEAYSSDEDDVPLASIKKNKQVKRKASSKKAKKSNTEVVRFNLQQ